jgi:hypothetical protein
MAERSRADASPDPLWRLRWLMLTGGLLCLTALVVVKLEVQDEWHSSLFYWGVGVGLAGALGIYLILSGALRTGSPDPAARLRFTRRRALYAWTWVGTGIGLGMFAAMFDLVWLDIAMAAYVVVVLVIGAVVLRRHARTS